MSSKLRHLPVNRQRRRLGAPGQKSSAAATPRPPAPGPRPLFLMLRCASSSSPPAAPTPAASRGRSPPSPRVPRRSPGAPSPRPSRPFSSAIEYVSGLTHIIARIQPCAVDMGKSDPETIHMGTSSRFMIAWKPEVESICQAMMNPSPVSANATRKTAPAMAGSCQTLTRTPASGAKARKISPCTQASVAGAEDLAQHHAGARRRGNQHGEQKPLAAVFDDRDGRKDGGEHHGEHQRAGEEAAQVARAVAHQQPEHQRRGHHAQHAALLPPEAHQLAPPQVAAGSQIPDLLLAADAMARPTVAVVLNRSSLLSRGRTHPPGSACAGPRIRSSPGKPPPPR